MRMRILVSVFIATYISFVLSSCAFFQSQSSDTFDYKSAGFPKMKSDIDLITTDSLGHRLLRDARKDFVVITILQSQKQNDAVVKNTLAKLSQLSLDPDLKNFEFQFIAADEKEDRDALESLASQAGLKQKFLIDNLQISVVDLGAYHNLDSVVVHKSSRSILTRLNASSDLDFKKHLLQLAQHNFQPIELTDSAATSLLTSPKILTEKTRWNYAKDIAPILEKNCIKCHNVHGLAPWAMDSYESVIQWKKMIREVLLVKRMPPAQSDTYYMSYQNETKPSTEEIRKLISWIDNGAENSSGQDPLKNLHIPPRKDFILGKPDLLIEVPEQHIGAEDSERVEILKIKWPLSYPVRVKGMDVQTDNIKATHHLSVYYLVPSKDQPNSYNVAAFDGGYIPGYEPMFLPLNTSYLVPANAPIRVSPHLVPTGKDEKIKMRIGYYFDKRPVPRELVHCGIDTKDIDIPPNTSNYTKIIQGRVTEDIRVIQLGTHMHSRGKSIKYTLTRPDGSHQILLSLPNYNRSWQREYVPKQPIFVPKDSLLTCEAHYDNSRSNPRISDPNKRITYGWYADNEMMTCSCFAMREGDYQRVLGKNKTPFIPEPVESNRDVIDDVTSKN